MRALHSCCEPSCIKEPLMQELAQEHDTPWKEIIETLFPQFMAFFFPTVKLLDLRSQWEELESTKNPFAMVVMAHLKAHATTRNRRGRLQWKLTLAKMLMERGYKDRQADGEPVRKDPAKAIQPI